MLKPCYIFALLTYIKFNYIYRVNLFYDALFFLIVSSDNKNNTFYLKNLYTCMRYTLNKIYLTRIKYT